MSAADFIYETLKEFGIDISYDAFAFERGGYQAAPDEIWLDGKYLGELRIYYDWSDCGNEYAVGCVINKEPAKPVNDSAYTKEEFRKVIEEAIRAAS